MSTISTESSQRNKILGVLKAPVTAELSVLFMQKIVSISMSNIACARCLCRDDSFNEREIHGIKMKILRDDMCENGYQIVTWLKGAFDALHKKYLRMIIFAVHTGSLITPALESYSYEFTYFNSEELQCVIRSTSSVSEETCSKYTVKRNIYCPEEVEKMTKQLFESCQKLGQVLKPLPEEKLLTMKLLYYDNVTPRDYEPPGFVAANGSTTVTYACEGVPEKFTLGFVSTEFHATKVRIQSTLFGDKKVTAVTEEVVDNQQEGSSDVSEDVIPETPEHQELAHVISPIQIEAADCTTAVSFSQDISHVATVQTATEQCLQEHKSAGVASPLDLYQFAVPQLLTKGSGPDVTSNDENYSSKNVSSATALAKAKKKKLPHIAEQGEEKVEPPTKKKKAKKVTKKVGKKNAKVRHSREVEENKENVDNMAILAANDTHRITAKKNDLLDMGDLAAVTYTTLTSKEIRGSEKGEISFTPGSNVEDEVAVKQREPVMKWKSKQARPAKSSVSQTTISMLDTSASSSMLAVEKDVSCCCDSFQEFGLMIRCEVCMTWQHSVCYGIMDGNSEFIEHHCCVQCAIADSSRQCTDHALLRYKGGSRKVLCIFRRALQLCHQQPTITKVVLQKEMELADDVTEMLVTQLKDKDIIKGSGPRSTLFTVNSEKLGEWLTRAFWRH